MDYDKIAKEAGELLEQIAEIAQERDLDHALGAVCVALQQAWKDGRECGMQETGQEERKFVLSETELEALDECTMAFAETCNPNDPEEWAIRNAACEAIEKLSRAAVEQGF